MEQRFSCVSVVSAFGFDGAPEFRFCRIECGRRKERLGQSIFHTGQENALHCQRCSKARDRAHGNQLRKTLPTFKKIGELLALFGIAGRFPMAKSFVGLIWSKGCYRDQSASFRIADLDAIFEFILAHLGSSIWLEVEM